MGFKMESTAWEIKTDGGKSLGVDLVILIVDLELVAGTGCGVAVGIVAQGGELRSGCLRWLYKGTGLGSP
jgi:hypothetical protein